MAVDGGPRETLGAAAAEYGLDLSEADAGETATEACWADLLESRGANLLVVGTSDSVRGRRIESAARRAACAAGVPVVVIEDFPGNYYNVANGAASLVVVESAAAREVCERRLGAGAPTIEVFTPARYDRHRARAPDLRRKTLAGWQAEGAAKVLWAGQPETCDCMRTLEALVPTLVTHGVELLFKAHPRDSGYSRGAYHALLARSGVPYADFTHASAEDALAESPRLVVTQFSSVAIEAGFFGVPGLWILLPNAGGARLLEKKGYARPPLCTAGGAALAGDTQAIPGAFRSALTDHTYRTHLLAGFDAYFGVGKQALPGLAERLRRVALKGK